MLEFSVHTGLCLSINIVFIEPILLILITRVLIVTVKDPVACDRSSSYRNAVLFYFIDEAIGYLST